MLILPTVRSVGPHPRRPAQVKFDADITIGATGHAATLAPPL
jgi:hypothetical protein